jgi:hypothetical protein
MTNEEIITELEVLAKSLEAQGNYIWAAMLEKKIIDLKKENKNVS